MKWKIEFSQTVRKQFIGLEKQAARRLLDFMDELAERINPRDLGVVLNGPLRMLWRYRVGYECLICDVQDAAGRILVLRLGKQTE